MLRLVFAFILLLHGLIHLIGFAKAYRYDDVIQLSREYTRWAAFLLLFSALMLMVS